MKGSVVGPALLLAALCPCVGAAAAGPKLTPAAFAEVRSQIADLLVETNAPSIAVAVTSRGEVVWEEGFGYADVQRRIPATAHTVYSLASISKPFTATALMILVERGLVDLDQPINRYLGEQKLIARTGSADDATVRRVAAHTSGLPTHRQFFHEDEPAVRPDMPESIRRYGQLLYAPGEHWIYSNFGYGLLEYVIERVTGKPYDAVIRDEIFTPLGMKESAVNRSPDLGGQVAVRYAPNGMPVPFYDFDHRGASAIFASAHDLVRFGRMHLKETQRGARRILRNDSIQAMQVPAVMSPDKKQGYGLGWVTGETLGIPAVGHTGRMAGVATSLTLLPDRDIAIAILSNAWSEPLRSGLEKIDAAIIRVLVPQTVVHERPAELGSKWAGLWRGAISTYAGTVPAQIDIRPDRRVLVRTGDTPEVEVTDVQLTQDGRLLLNQIDGSVGTADAARYPYRLDFDLQLRGSELSGAVTAISRPLAGRDGNALSSWIALRKAP